MPPRVRKGRQTAASVPSTSSNTDSSTSALIPQSDPFPARVALLPTGLSENSRIHTLPRPSSGVACRYVVCPMLGFFELSRVSPSVKQPRSWLVSAEKSDEETLLPTKRNCTSTKLNEKNCKISADAKSISPHSALLSSEADLFVASPFDPLFFLIPVLLPQSRSHQDDMFLEQDDFLDRLTAMEGAEEWAEIISIPTLRDRLLARLDVVCDSVSAGDEKMIRASPSKLYQVLMSKARRVADAGLPASIEAKFIQAALERPSLRVQKIGQKSDPDPTVSSESQTTDEIISLMRLRTALDIVLGSLSQSCQDRLTTQLTEEALKVDFQPLEEHLSCLALDREQVRASRTAAEAFSSGYKRTLDSEEQTDIRAEKKRKKDEEDKRKKNVSRGLKSLQKVNVGGMQKLSSFFKKVEQ